MNTESVIVRLTDVFREVFGNDSLHLFSEMTPELVEGWDSLGHIRLVLSTEQAFDVQFGSAEIAELANVGDFVNLISRKLTNELPRSDGNQFARP